MLQALQAVATAVGHSLDVEEVIQTAIAELRRVVGVEAAGLYLLDPPSGILALTRHEGVSPAFVERVRSFRPGEEPMAGEAIASKTPVAFPVGAYPNPALRPFLEAEGFRFVASFPLLSRGQVLGALNLGWRTKDPFSQEELEFLGSIGSVVGTALENATLYQELLAHQDRLRALAAGIMTAREEEARRIAHALHDETGQLLASIHIGLEEVARGLPPPAQKQLQGMRGLLDQVEAHLRRLSHELRPTILDDLGLQPALEFLIQGVSARLGIPIMLEGSREGRLPPLIETALYRIVQEALTNVTKHAQATRCKIQLQREARRIRCVIQDNGVGFDVPTVLAQRGERGLGLIGIRERLDALGGTLQLTSAPGQGTELSITIPLET